MGGAKEGSMRRKAKRCQSRSSPVPPRRKSARLAALVAESSASASSSVQRPEQREAAAESASLGPPCKKAEGGGGKEANAEPNVEDMKPLIIPILKRVKWSTSTRVVDHIIEKLGYTWYLVYIFIHVSAVAVILSAYVTPARR